MKQIFTYNEEKRTQQHQLKICGFQYERQFDAKFLMWRLHIYLHRCRQYKCLECNGPNCDPLDTSRGILLVDREQAHAEMRAWNSVL